MTSSVFLNKNYEENYKVINYNTCEMVIVWSRTVPKYLNISFSFLLKSNWLATNKINRLTNYVSMLYNTNCKQEERRFYWVMNRIRNYYKAPNVIFSEVMYTYHLKQPPSITSSVKSIDSFWKTGNSTRG